MSQIKPKTPPSWWFNTATAPPLWARALAAVYGALATLRRWLYARGWLRVLTAPVPIIVVGNLIAGGSGKTPLVIALVERLRADGFTPGVASRGHGRTQPRTPRWVDADTPAHLGGDEPVLIARRTGARVRVDTDRAAAARALAEAGCDVVVCDDGLQHYRLHRDVEIEVIDGRRRYGNGRLLPAGPLREPPARGAQCDFRVLNVGNNGAFGSPLPAGEGAGVRVSEHTPFPLSEAAHWPMRLVSSHAQPLNGARAIPLSQFTDLRIHAVAGIGDPERFFSLLRETGMLVIPHAFPDHHPYHAEDFHFASRHLPVLMTEKDAVKCTPIATEQMYSIPVTAQLPEAFWAALLHHVRRARRRIAQTDTGYTDPSFEEAFP